MTPAVHDEVLARISHLPHLIAYALVASVGDARVDGRPVLEYAGTGFRDTTRIAASPAEIWRDVALANAVPLRTAVAAFRVTLDRLEQLVATGDGAGLERLLASARALRQRLGRGD